MGKQEKRSNLRPVSNSRSQLLETGLQGLKSTKAFTLVELIVVITILAILGTIAFISLQGYSQDARDSVRISDMSKIKTSLELFQLDAGKYPETTDDYFNVTYSGAIARTQGFFGKTTFSNVEKLDKIPKDPLTEKKYIYSTTNTRQEFEIAGVMEGDEVSFISNKVTAGDKTAILKITGTYNGKILKVSTGSMDYVLAVPSIINGSGFTLEEIIPSKYLAYNGYKNLPAQYDGGTYNVLGDPDIILVNPNDYVVFSGDIKNLSDTTSIGIDARKDLLTNLQSAYLGTDIVNIGEISQIINTSITNTGAVEFLSTTIVSNDLGGSIAVSTGGGTQTSTNSCATQPSYTHATFTVGTPTSVNQEYVKDATNCGYTCTDGYTGTSCEIASITDWRSKDSNCTIPDVTIGTQSWAGCNSTIGTGFEWGKKDDGNNGTIGSCYNYEGTNNAVNCPIGGASMASSASAITFFNAMQPDGTNQNGDSEFNTIWGKLYTWNSLDTDNDNDIDTNDTNKVCGTGYHIPTDAEWTALENYLSGTNCRTGDGWQCDGFGWRSNISYNPDRKLAEILKIPLAGHRDIDGVTFLNRGHDTLLWSSTPYNGNAYNKYLYRYYSTVGRSYDNQSKGFSVRCLKD